MGKSLLYTNTINNGIVKPSPASLVMGVFRLRTSSDLGTGKEKVTFYWGG